MATTQDIEWPQADRVLDLDTDIEHEIRIQREAIPLIFVPGIMGSRLRRAGTNGEGTGTDGLPNMRWDPSSDWWMLRNYFNRGPERRRAMLIGPGFNPGYLEVDDAKPAEDGSVGDGFQGIRDKYHDFLEPLRDRNWHPLSKLFEFPVYAFSYNWSDDSTRTGAQLADRITKIMAEAKKVSGICEKVIIITHSMGGLVARAASELHGARSSILGIIHGVQPAMGAPAAYWRMKGGFESLGIVLGSNGREVTAVLGNMPGGLQLLPNKLHVTNGGDRDWLRIVQDGATIRSLPRADPYREIYREPAVIRPRPGERPSTNAYWGLVDPALLTPGNVAAAATPPPASGQATDPNQIDGALSRRDAWSEYLEWLGKAEAFHDQLGRQVHPRTFSFTGQGHETADVVRLVAEPDASGESYGSGTFRGFFLDGAGRQMRAVLQQPDGGGDGTVPISSAEALNSRGKSPPGDVRMAVEHEPAFAGPAALAYTIRAVTALCRERYRTRRGGPGDFPTPTSANRTA